MINASIASHVTRPRGIRVLIGMAVAGAVIAAGCFCTQVALADEPAAKPSIAVSGSKNVTLKGNPKVLPVKKTGDVGTITWKSSKPKVVSVSKSGVVKGKAFGTSTVTAKANGKKLKWKVTVSKVKITIFDGKSKKLSKYSKYLKKYKKGTWKSSKNKVVSIKKGKLKAHKKGKATLKFKVGKNAYKLVVTVNCKHKWVKDKELEDKYWKLQKEYKEKSDDAYEMAELYDYYADLYNARGNYSSAMSALKIAGDYIDESNEYLEESNMYYEMYTKAYKCKKCGKVK